jgi:hypothetical protein
MNKFLAAATVLLIPLSAQAQTRPHAKDRPASQLILATFE